MSEFGDKLKIFLSSRLSDCEQLIVKRKRKNKLIKLLYYSLITSSIIGNSVVIILTSVSLPPLSVLIVSGVTGVLTTLSVKFNLQGNKSKLINNIQKLNMLRGKLDYVINCNGDMTKEECDAIIEEFSRL
jgi:hypothetical protein